MFSYQRQHLDLKQLIVCLSQTYITCTVDESDGRINGITPVYVCTHMSKTHQASCAPSYHKSLKETDKGDLTTEFMASLYSLNTLKTEQMSSVRMLNALHGS